MTSASTCKVLDFDPRDVDEEAAAKTRRLLGRVLAVQGPTGLAQALHVTASRAAQLKHRVACVTCRSRLDTLATSLATTAGSASAEEKVEDLIPLEYPAPLSAWLAVDKGRGLEPAPRALRDPGALAAFLAAFGGSSGDGAETGTTGANSSSRSGRSSGVDRCPHHAPRTTASRVATPSLCAPSQPPPACRAVSHAMTPRERERYVAILQCSTTDAEWRRLGSVEIESTMCDLFSWLGDRGLCSACVDAVTGALLEVRRAVTGNCTCSRCLGLCRAGGGASSGTELALASKSSGPHIGPPELLRVQGQLRAICGVYRLEALPFNGKPVYKKERAEAYLLYTSLKDWMVSGKADAGGSKCEGWAYVTDPAETPDEVCGVWKVSGPRGWEEDSSLCVTVFEGLPEDMRVGVGYDDGSFIAKRLTADDRGVLMVPLQEPEVLGEVLWAPDEPAPICMRSGSCTHVTTAEMAQLELRCWLRWLLRERLDAHRRNVLAQAQVAAALCRTFAGAALQQLEAAAEESLSTPPKREKKSRSKKNRLAISDVVAKDEIHPSLPTDAIVPDDGTTSVVKVGDVPVNTSPASASTATSEKSPTTVGCHTGNDESASSTRASSEEPKDAQCAELATGAQRLMEQMGWQPDDCADDDTIGHAEIAAWREQHPSHRQAVDEERQKLKSQFQKWTKTTER